MMFKDPLMRGFDMPVDVICSLPFGLPGEGREGDLGELLHFGDVCLLFVGGGIRPPVVVFAHSTHILSAVWPLFMIAARSSSSVTMDTRQSCAALMSQKRAMHCITFDVW